MTSIVQHVALKFIDTKHHLSVVLVEPTQPGNVGAVARAMDNMGVQDLRLVNPCDHLGAEARQMATHSCHVLECAQVYPSLEAAVADRQLILGTTARPRDRARRITRLWNVHRLVGHGSAPMALVFGRESSGLTNTEIAVCSDLVQIPTFGETASLNLSQAVVVTLYEISKLYGTSPLKTPSPPAPATSSEIEGLKRHFFDVLGAVGFLKQNQGSTLWSSFSDLIARAKPTALDVRLMRGFFHRIQVTLNRGRAGTNDECDTKSESRIPNPERSPKSET